MCDGLMLSHVASGGAAVKLFFFFAGGPVEASWSWLMQGRLCSQIVAHQGSMGVYALQCHQFVLGLAHAQHCARYLAAPNEEWGYLKP